MHDTTPRSGHGFCFRTSIWFIAGLVALFAANLDAQHNTTTTFSGGGSTNLGGALTIGNTGTNNTLLISNGTIVSNTIGTIGNASTANFNSGLVTGNGSAWYNTSPGADSGSLFVGYNGSSNTLTISNGGVVNTAGLGVMMGYQPGSVGNSITVTGNGAVFTNILYLSVGYFGASNQLSVLNRGVVDINANINLSYGFGAPGSKILVDGSGSLLNMHNSLLVGQGAGSGSLVTIQNGGRMDTVDARVGDHPISAGHQIIVTGAGSTWSNGSQSIAIGTAGYNNSLIITNGGTVLAQNNSTGLNYIGRDSTGSNNYILVTGTGSTFVNKFGITIGNSGSSNALIIANGGTVRVMSQNAGFDWSLTIGANAGSANNLVRIDGGQLIVTNNFASTPALDVRRGKLEFNSGLVDTERLLANVGASSVVQFNGGTLITRSTTVSNGSAFVVGNGVSVAKLRLNGGTHSFANGLSINTASRLEGNGTVQGNTTVDGTLAPGNSPGQVTFVGNLSLSSAATYEVDLNGTTPGTLYDQAVVNGGVSLGNSTLSLALGYSPTTGDQFTIISNDLSDAVSGTFGGLTEGSLISVNAGGLQTFSVSYIGGDGNDVVLTFLIPEPTSTMLLALAFGAVLRLRRR